jgi:hypothetical protein
MRRRRKLTPHAAVWATGGGASYTGPGDVVSTWDMWGGLRSFNAAYATGSNNALDIVDQAGNNPLTVKILSDGTLDVASVATWVTAHTVTTIRVAKAYDQTGNGFHWTQATLSKMPTLVLSAFGALPGLRFDDGVDNEVLSSSATYTKAMPINVTAVCDQIGEIGFNVGIIKTEDQAAGLRTVGTDQVVLETLSDFITATCTNNALHSINGTMNGGSSKLNVDGTETNTTNLGGTGPSATTVNIGAQQAANGRTYNGYLNEWGFQSSGGAWDTTKRNSMKNNQKAYWGTP